VTRIRTAILLTFALGLVAGTAWGAFPNLSVSPRSRAMGDAAVAVPGDAFAPYHNPALLGAMRRPTIGTSYVRPYGLDFHDLFYLGGAIPLPTKYGAIGYGLRLYGSSYQDVDLEKETTFTLAHGLPIYSDLHSTINFGYALNLYRLEFGPTVGTDGQGTGGFDPGNDVAFSLDAALYITLHERTHLGVLTKNLTNSQIGQDNEELPQRIHGGISYEPYVGVITTFEIESELGQPAMYHGGVEMEVVSNFRTRFGIQAQPAKLMFGFGYAVTGLTIDYGFSTGGGVLDTSHQFGLTYSWGGTGE